MGTGLRALLFVAAASACTAPACSIVNSLDEYENGSLPQDAAVSEAGGDAAQEGGCPDGFGDCDGVPSNGCEADLIGSTDHCGTCGNACPAPANAQALCEGATCTFSCSGMFGDCDGDEANGCETSLADDPARCGACDRSCPEGFSCEVGICACKHHSDCDYGGGGKCFSSAETPVCECDGVACAPGEVCLPGPVCGQN